MKEVQDIQENFKRGIIDYVILLLLNEEDMYPYQISQEVTERSHGKLKFFVGSMYGPIRRMMANNEITERRVIVGERRFRNYYHIEPAGKEYLSAMQKEYNDLIAGIRYMVQSTDKHEGK